MILNRHEIGSFGVPPWMRWTWLSIKKDTGAGTAAGGRLGEGDGVGAIEGLGWGVGVTLDIGA